MKCCGGWRCRPFWVCFRRCLRRVSLCRHTVCNHCQRLTQIHGNAAFHCSVEGRNHSNAVLTNGCVGEPVFVCCPRSAAFRCFVPASRPCRHCNASVSSLRPRPAPSLCRHSLLCLTACLWFSGSFNMASAGAGDVAYKIVLLRHGESEWNKANKFTGWTDVDLTETGVGEAHAAAAMLKDAGITFDVAFTSVLKRAIKTLWCVCARVVWQGSAIPAARGVAPPPLPLLLSLSLLLSLLLLSSASHKVDAYLWRRTGRLVLEDLDLHWIPVQRDYRLNERHYGALQGLNKAETAAKHGDDQVKIWRRSYDIPPPELEDDDERHPSRDARYAGLPAGVLPKSESLKLTVDRVLPFWESDIAPAIRGGKRVLIAAHGNSLRALVKYLDDVSESDITELNIPTSALLFGVEESAPLVFTASPPPCCLRVLVRRAACVRAGCGFEAHSPLLRAWV